jgi:hypothetical protein
MAKKDDQNKEIIASSSLAIPDSEEDSEKLVEITAYIREDQLLALEILQTAEQQKRGEFYDGSKLIQEAIDLLIKKHIIAVKLNK